MEKQRRWFLFVTSVVLLVGGVTGASARDAKSLTRASEIRSVWMDRNSIPKTEEGIREMIRSYARAGINMVHPEVIFNGYSAYPSSYLTQKDLWPGVDMPGVLIDESHKNGIEVHPWVWVFRAGYTADKGGFLPQHPDWAMLDKHGRDATSNGSYWVSPCHPAVRHTLLRAYEELVRKYDVDGIELDYVRFPSADYGYEPVCREKFELQTGIDPLKIEPFTKQVIEWHSWRENQINSFVQEVSETLKKIRPGIQISAAVASFPDQARTTYLQNWEHWSENKWVDFLAPMDYTTNNTDFVRRITDTKEKIGQTSLLAPGIGLIYFKGVEMMLEQIATARDLAVPGVTLFATAYLGDDRLQALREGPFREKAQLPTRDPMDGARALLASAREKMKGEHTLDALEVIGDELDTAKTLVGYRKYQKMDVGYIPPEPPPIFIPDVVVPIPEARIPESQAAPTIDGKLDEAFWANARRLTLDYTALGDKAPEPTEVFVGYDAENLYVAYRATEPRMDDIRATVTERDGPVFNDDSLEMFIDVGGQGKDYFQFALNTLGTKYEAQSYVTAFNPEWQASAGKETNSWTAEMAIPFSALKVTGTPANSTWRVNFCRNRVLNREPSSAQATCWVPTYGSYHTPGRFGRIVFGQEVR